MSWFYWCSECHQLVTDSGCVWLGLRRAEHSGTHQNCWQKDPCPLWGSFLSHRAHCPAWCSISQLHSTAGSRREGARHPEQTGRTYLDLVEANGDGSSRRKPFNDWGGNEVQKKTCTGQAAVSTLLALMGSTGCLHAHRAVTRVSRTAQCLREHRAGATTGCTAIS